MFANHEYSNMTMQYWPDGPGLPLYEIFNNLKGYLQGYVRVR